jgi:hypothetical protein
MSNVRHCSLQVFCIFLFLCAASLFGTIIAQVNEIVADLTTKKKELDLILEAYLALNPRSAPYTDLSCVLVGRLINTLNPHLTTYYRRNVDRHH